MPKLILASQSPRRQELLKGLGLSFDIKPADVDETPIKGEHPRDYVQRVCLDKAQEIAKDNKGCTVLAADTICVMGRRIIGKPEDAGDAANILRMMSGKRQHVYTAVCAIDENGKARTYLSDSIVKFVPLQEKDIQKYVANEDNWQGKAGGYNLNMSTGGSFVKWIQGSPSGIIGLPLSKTVHLLRACGHDV